MNNLTLSSLDTGEKQTIYSVHCKGLWTHLATTWAACAVCCHPEKCLILFAKELCLQQTLDVITGIRSWMCESLNKYKYNFKKAKLF